MLRGSGLLLPLARGEINEWARLCVLLTPSLPELYEPWTKVLVYSVIGPP